jgi:hypothetical protein
MAKKMYASVDFQGNSAIGLADASVANGAATWGQVQAFVRGNRWKDAVKAATTANITLSGTQTIDGISIVASDEVLVKNQSTGSQNGVYVASAGAWTRRADMATGSNASGASMFVQQGTANGDKQFVQTADPAVVGTDALTFTLLGGGSTYVAGNGLSESPAGTFNVDPGTASATGLEISSDTIRIAAVAAGAGLTGGGGSALAVGAGTGVTVNANDVAIDTSVVPRRYTNSATHSAGTTVSLTHSIGHLDYTTSVKIQATGEEITDGVEISCTTTAVTATFSASQGANTIRLTVIG